MKESPVRIDFSKKFLKQLKKVPLEVLQAYRRRLEIFLQSPFHPLLDNHGLTGEFQGFRSINITGDWRVLFSEYFDESGRKVILFHMIGTHSQLYR